jgi:hypothetical protein
MCVPWTKYWFHTASTKYCNWAASAGRLVRPPSTSCQIVAGSPASAAATMVVLMVGSCCAVAKLEIEVPPTSTA